MIPTEQMVKRLRREDCGVQGLELASAHRARSVRIILLLTVAAVINGEMIDVVVENRGQQSRTRETEIANLTKYSFQKRKTQPLKASGQDQKGISSTIGKTAIYKVRDPSQRKLNYEGWLEGSDQPRDEKEVSPQVASLHHSSAFPPSRPWKPTRATSFYRNKPTRKPSHSKPTRKPSHSKPTRKPSHSVPPPSEDLPPAFSRDVPSSSPSMVKISPTTSPTPLPTVSLQPSVPVPSSQPSPLAEPTPSPTARISSVPPTNFLEPSFSQAPSQPQDPTPSPQSPTMPPQPSLSNMPSEVLPPETMVPTTVPQQPTVSQAPSSPSISLEPSSSVQPPPVPEPQIPTSSVAPTSPTISSQPSTVVQPPPVPEPQIPTIPPAPTTSSEPSSVVQPPPVPEPQIPTISPAPTSPTISSQPSNVAQPPPVPEPQIPTTPPEPTTSFQPSSVVQPPPVPEPQIPTFSPAPTSPTISARPSSAVQPPPVQEPQLPNISPQPTSPTISPMPSTTVEPPDPVSEPQMPTLSPQPSPSSAVDAPTTDQQQISTFPTVPPAPMDPVMNRTISPNMTLPPNSTIAPSPQIIQPPGGGGPLPPGGGIQPPGGNGTATPGTQPPGGGNTEVPGPLGGGGPSPPDSSGGEPSVSGGGGTTSPGSRQFDTDNLSVTLPPYTLLFFLSNQENADNDSNLRPKYPTHADYTVLESLTNSFLRTFVLDTIGNGLNVVLDDLQTVVLSKPSGVQQPEDGSTIGMEVVRSGSDRVGNDFSSSSIDNKMPLMTSLYIIFVSTAVFDATSPTLPRPNDLLHHIEEAFVGKRLMTYLSMLQSLQHEQDNSPKAFFASTTDILWVTTPTPNNDNTTSVTATSDGGGSSTTSRNLGPIIAFFSIAVIVLFLIILRLQYGVKCCWPFPRNKAATDSMDDGEKMFQSSSSIEIYENDDDDYKMTEEVKERDENENDKRATLLSPISGPVDPPGLLFKSEFQGWSNKQIIYKKKGRSLPHGMVGPFA